MAVRMNIEKIVFSTKTINPKRKQNFIQLL